MRSSIGLLLRVSVAAACLGSAFTAFAGDGVWTSGGPYGATPGIAGIVVDPSHAVYVGTSDGVFKSTDAGASWRAASNGLTSIGVYSLAVSPSQPTTLYAGTNLGGVGISTDSGATWRGGGEEEWDDPNGMCSYQSIVTGIAVSPSVPSTIYMAYAWGGCCGQFCSAGSGVASSTDAGATWKYGPGRRDQGSAFVAADPLDPSTAYATFGEASIQKTTDAGDSWTAITTGLEPPGSHFGIGAMAIAPATSVSPRTLYASTSVGLIQSTDGGATWSLANGGLATVGVTILAIDPITPSVLYATAFRGGIYRSVDSGTTWSMVSPALGDEITSLAVDPSTTSTLYAGTQNTSDGWNYTGGVFRSTDSGETWTPCNSGFTNVLLNLTLDPSNPATLYGVTADKGLLRSTDSGNTWSAIGSGLGGVRLGQLAIHPAAPATLYLATSEGVFKSTDSGATWSSRNAGLTSQAIATISIHPANPATLYAAASRTVFRSTDSGETWVEIGHTPFSVGQFAIDPSSVSTLYAGSYEYGLFKSTDSGATWSSVTTGLANYWGYIAVQALVIDPLTPSTLYTGLWRAGLYKSTDSGRTWSAANAGLGNLDVRALAIDPQAPSRVYAGTWGGGVFESTDAGDTWAPLNAGLGNSFVFGLWIDAFTPTTLHAALSYGSVWHITRSTPLQADFSFSPAAPLIGQAVTFRDASTGHPTSWSWSFGDGSSSAFQNPSHAYASPGNYTVTLTVSSGTSQSTKTRIVSVHTWPPPAITTFTASPTTIAPGETSTLTWSTTDATSASIDQGIGDVPTFGSVVVEPPAGVVTYTLAVTGRGGTARASVTITDSAPLTGGYTFVYAVDAAAVNPNAVPANKAIRFTASDTAETYAWVFGDGSPVGSGSQFTHAFANAGSFPVKLKVTKAGQSTVTTPNPTVFTVLPPPPDQWVVLGLAYTDVWQSDVAFFNPSATQPMTLSLAFLDSVSPVFDPAQLAWTRIVIPRLSTRTYTNVLANPPFAAPKGHWGAILVRGDVVPATPILTSRTYATDTSGGTYGLTLPSSSTASGIGQQTPGASRLLIGLKESSAAYTNLAVVNLEPDTSSVQVTFSDASGASLGSPVTFNLGPYGVLQLAHALSADPPGGAGYRQPADTYSASIRLVTGTTVTAYATVIDTVSRDPIVITPRLEPASTYRMPGIVRVQGANGTVWRSDVVIYNASTLRRKVDVTYVYRIPPDQPHSEPGPITLESGQTLSVSDFVRTILQLPEGDTTPYASSWIDFSPAVEDDGSTNADPLLVTGKTYDDQPTGSVGLQVAGYAADDGASRAGPKKRLLLTGLSSSAAYRTNLAFFLLPGTSLPQVSATVNVYDADGSLIRQAALQLDSVTGFFQMNDGALFGDLPADERSQMSVIVDDITGNAAIAGYATIVDNVSGDGTFVQAVPAP